MESTLIRHVWVPLPKSSRPCPQAHNNKRKNMNMVALHVQVGYDQTFSGFGGGLEEQIDFQNLIMLTIQRTTHEGFLQS